MNDLTPTLGNILPNEPLPSKIVELLRLKRRLFYVIPKELVEAIQHVLPGVINDKDLEFEIELASEATKRNAVAFRDGRPVGFNRLAPLPRPIEPEFLLAAADPVAEALEVNTVLVEVHEWCQAYMGWLVKNPEYRSDISTLAGIGCHQCSPIGTPPPYPADVDGKYELLFRAEHQKQVRDICKKWRLDGFATLDLPRPLEPHFIACSPYNENSRDGGSAPFLPDIYPIKGRGEVLDRIRATQSRQDTGHLGGWMDLIASSSKKSPHLTSLARQFRLQHHWRVVHDRYAKELARKKTLLYRSFAIFLGENAETIRKEVPKLKASLGIPLSDWQ